MPPPGIQVQHKISLNRIIVTWNAINEKAANGRFRGYRVKYTVRKIGGVDAMITDRKTKVISVDKYTFKVKISGLTSYTSYDISICGFTAAGDGPYSHPILAGKILYNWYFYLSGKALF